MRTSSFRLRSAGHALMATGLCAVRAPHGSAVRPAFSAGARVNESSGPAPARCPPATSPTSVAA